MAEYDSAVALALRLIKKKGRADGRITRFEGEADPDRPWAPGDPENVVMAEDLPVVVLDAKLMLAGFTSKGPTILASLAPEATAIAFVAAASMASPPLTGDVLETRSERYAVLEVEDLAPGSQSIVYILHLKA